MHKFPLIFLDTKSYKLAIHPLHTLKHSLEGYLDYLTGRISTYILHYKVLSRVYTQFKVFVSKICNVTWCSSLLSKLIIIIVVYCCVFDLQALY